MKYLVWGLVLFVVIVLALFAVAVHAGVLNDPDGKESNPEYWEALKEMRERENQKK